MRNIVLLLPSSVNLAQIRSVLERSGFGPFIGDGDELQWSLPDGSDRINFDEIDQTETRLEYDEDFPALLESPDWRFFACTFESSETAARMARAILAEWQEGFVDLSDTRWGVLSALEYLNRPEDSGPAWWSRMRS